MKTVHGISSLITVSGNISCNISDSRETAVARVSFIVQ